MGVILALAPRECWEGLSTWKSAGHTAAYFAQLLLLLLSLFSGPVWGAGEQVEGAAGKECEQRGDDLLRAQSRAEGQGGREGWVAAPTSTR